MDALNNVLHEINLEELPEEVRRLIPTPRESENLAPINPEKDKALFAYFSTEPRFNPLKTAEMGRPIFDQVTYVNIHLPGGDSTIKHAVTEKNEKYWSRRFPAQWAKFKEQAVAQLSGTPIDELPFLHVGRCAEYKAMKVFTVEQLASLSDEQISRFGLGAREERQKAQAWLDKSQKMEAVYKAQEENARLTAQIEELQAQLKEIQEKMKMKVPTRAKKGTSKKDEVEIKVENVGAEALLKEGKDK